MSDEQPKHIGIQPKYEFGVMTRDPFTGTADNFSGDIGTTLDDAKAIHSVIGGEIVVRMVSSWMTYHDAFEAEVDLQHDD